MICPLEFSREEVSAALSYFSSDKSLHLRGEQANIQTVRQAINEYDILHFSTHGYADFSRPSSSGLLMASREILTLYELSNMDLDQPRLAVLSACETGMLADIQRVDEVVSLPSALIQAGIPGVISSLWSVNDLSTALLMAWFYYFWKHDNMQIPEALRHAQIFLRSLSKEQLETFLDGRTQNELVERLPDEVVGSLIKYIRAKTDSSADPVFRHPFYWAAFTYVGA